MTQDQRKQAVLSYLLAQGIITPEDVEREVNKLAEACPAAMITDKNLTDVYDKAYESVAALTGAQTPANITDAGNAPSMPATQVTAAEQRSIAEALTKDKAMRAIASSDSILEVLVVDKPAPAELIKAGTKGSINKDSWDKLATKWSDKVLPDDDTMASTTNFKTLAAAAANGTLVDVQISSPALRPIAVRLQAADPTGNSKKSEVLNIEQLQNFVTLKADGYVKATEKTAGAKLRYVKPTKDKKNPAIIKPGRTTVVITNKANATTVVSRDILPEIKEDAACKSALAFKVNTGRKKADGVTPIYSTVHASVKAPVNLTERKAEYIDALGNVGKGSGNSDLLSTPDAKAMAQINMAQVAQIAALKAKVASGDFETINNYGSALAAFEVKAPAANANVSL